MFEAVENLPKLGPLKNATRGILLAEQTYQAATFVSRLKGLLGRSSLAPSTALCIEACNSVHTFFMRFPIDVVFVDQRWIVRKIVFDMKPWQMTLPSFASLATLEFAAGTLDDTKIAVGDQLHVGH